MTFWTPEHTDTLRRMWDTDETCREIAYTLGCTRNAVIGKAHRMKLAPRVPGFDTQVARVAFAASITKRADDAAKRKTEAQQRHPKWVRLKAPRKPAEPPEAKKPAFILTPELIAAAQDVVVAGSTWAALPGTAPIPFDARRASQCSWMIGDNRPRMCCGEQVKPGASFCPTHQAVAYRQIPQVERNAARKKYLATRAKVSSPVFA